MAIQGWNEASFEKGMIWISAVDGGLVDGHFCRDINLPAGHFRQSGIVGERLKAENARLGFAC
jgi:hypothetical protein